MESYTYMHLTDENVVGQNLSELITIWLSCERRQSETFLLRRSVDLYYMLHSN